MIEMSSKQSISQLHTVYYIYYIYMHTECCRWCCYVCCYTAVVAAEEVLLLLAAVRHRVPDSQNLVLFH